MTECMDGDVNRTATNDLIVKLAPVLDWQSVANQRLKRLVEIEHIHALLVDRHEALHVDHREVARNDVIRLQRIRFLGQQNTRLRDEVSLLADRLDTLARTQAALLNSRSWRMTKPLRAAARWTNNPRRTAKNGLLLLARPALVRRVVKQCLTLTPRLRDRVIAFMYPRAR